MKFGPSMALTILDLTGVPISFELERVSAEILEYLVLKEIDRSEVIISCEINAGVSVQHLKLIASGCGFSESLVSWRLPLRRPIFGKSTDLSNQMMELLRLRIGASKILKLTCDALCSEIGFIEVPQTTNARTLECALAEMPGLSEIRAGRAHLKDLSRSIAIAWPSVRKYRVFIDVSSIIKNDLGTGIQRVIRNLIPEVMAALPDNYEFRLVSSDENGGPFYHVDFKQFQDTDEIRFKRSNEVVEFIRSDVFLGLDLNYGVTLSHSVYFSGLQLRGVKLVALIYDLLPVQFPQFFPQEVSALRLHERYLEVVSTFDLSIAISKSVHDDYVEWVRKNSRTRLINQRTGHIPLGSGLSRIISKQNLNEYGSYFLHVGTIEPRKNVEQILEAFELLWKQGLDINLVLVGKAGWNMDGVLDRIRSHIEIGKKLHWVQTADDTELSNLYRNASCLIMASSGEGYGLPIVEAHSFGTRVLARNIPVFKEVCGAHDFFFDGGSGQDLASAILGLPKGFEKEETIEAPAWKNSALELVSLLELS